MNIRGLEIGYGTTSVTVNDDGTDVVTFPSIVVSCDQTAEEKLGFGSSSSIKVYLDKSKSFLVGNELDERTVSTRDLTSDYVTTDQYKALFYAAISKLDVDQVDLLVCGLPVNNMSVAPQVEKLVVGEHNVIGRKINIKRCLVVSQPLGTLANHLNSIDANDEQVHSKKLVIDCGYHTVDFIVATAFDVSSTLNGAVDGGMSKLLEACQVELAKTFKKAPSVQAIDRAFYANYQGNERYIKLFGNKYAFPVCGGHTVDKKAVNERFDLTPQIERVTDEAANFIANKVGDGHDIDEIIVGGGSGPHYLDAIKRRFPKHNITLVKSPLTSVCMGLHDIGKMVSD